MAVDWLTQLRLRGLMDPSSMMDSNMMDSNQSPSVLTIPSSPSLMNQVSSGINPSVIGEEPSEYDIGKRMSQLYRPETQASTRLNQMLNSFPQRGQSGFLRKLGAGLIGAATTEREGPTRGIAAGQEFLNRPFNQALGDWEAKIKPIEQAANLERYQNVNERTLAYQTVSNELRQQAEQHRVEKNERDAEIKEHRASVYEYKALHPNAVFDFKGPTVLVADPATKKVEDTKIPTGSMSKIDQMNLGQTQALERIERKAEVTPESWHPPIQTYNPDGTPGKVIQSSNQGNIREVTVPGGGTVKPSSITSSTRTMMEGAQMVLPHIKELRDQATDLEKRGLFGPIMSRVRNIAAKLGTTDLVAKEGGDDNAPDKLNQFANAITSDPLINQSNDAVVGQFLTNLGLMASGAGRVHGGARGGGSVQMVNYLKSLISSDSTLSMFNGRMNALESYMKGYAVGPGGKTVVGKKDKLDEIFDKLFPR